MTRQRTLPPFLLFLAFFLLSATVTLSSQREDPELRKCREECQQQPHYDEGMRRKCERRCEEQQPRREEERERERGPGREEFNPQDPREKLEQCRQECQQTRRGEEQQRQCQRRCEERYEEERRQQERDQERDPKERLRECQEKCRRQRTGRERQRECEQRCEEEYRRQTQREGSPMREEQEGEGERTERNPYFFGRESFRHQVRTQHGHVRVLKKFHEHSELLLGIANYRLAILEANPNTFVLPAHWDAESVFYVVRGRRGSISLMHKEHRETHNLRQGDIIRVPAGAIVYLINKDHNEKLIVAKLLQPVFTPGNYEVFHGAAGRDPESFYRTFSNEILEAAFNTPRDRLERLFGQQEEGAIIKASEEQIREMGREEGGGGQWPFGESTRPFNLLEKRPTHSNERGQLYEASANDYPGLRDLDIQVSFLNLSYASMTSPFYNSKSTKIALVTDGTGYVEIVCPHMAKQSGGRTEGGRQREQEEEEEQGQGQGRRGQRYQRIRSEVNPGMVFVVRPGHPVVEVASRGENLQAICFEIRAENNEKIFLAGQNNILNQMDRVAKELSFAKPIREVDEVLNAQKDRVFLAGPEERGRRHRPLEPILAFAGF